MHLTEPPDGTAEDAARAEQRQRALDEDHRVCDAIEALPDGDTMHAWVTRFALLADPTRLTLLLCIHAAGEICVSDLALAAGPQGHHHLAGLAPAARPGPRRHPAQRPRRALPAR